MVFKAALDPEAFELVETAHHGVELVTQAADRTPEEACASRGHGRAQDGDHKGAGLAWDDDVFFLAHWVPTQKSAVPALAAVVTMSRADVAPSESSWEVEVAG